MNGCFLVEWNSTVLDPDGVVVDSADSFAPLDTAWNETPYYPSSFAELGDPCANVGPIYSLYFPREGQGWVGCGNGAGLHHSQDDGASFEEILPGNNLYVFDLREDRPMRHGARVRVRCELSEGVNRLACTKPVTEALN